eukprot:6208195-Pleurochrysis_carterae.AAC.1
MDAHLTNIQSRSAGFLTFHPNTHNGINGIRVRLNLTQTGRVVLKNTSSEVVLRSCLTAEAVEGAALALER